MSDQSYRIQYQSCEDVVFPSKRGMQTYLQNESALWTPFLDSVRDGLGSSIRRDREQAVSPETIALSLSQLSNKLDNRSDFNSSTDLLGRSPLIPPPSDSINGLLILGLFDADLSEEALGCFVYFLSKEVDLRIQSDQRLATLIELGKPLVDAAPVVMARPYSKVSSAKFAGAVRTAENHVHALADEVSKAQDAAKQHEAALNEHLDQQKGKAERINATVLRLNRRRHRKQKVWVAATEEMIVEAFDDARKKVRLFEIKSKRAEEGRVREFERLQDLFAAQLRLRAPVALWEGREKRHTAQAKSAMTRFLAIGAVAISFGLGLPFLAGEYIAATFYENVCSISATEAVAATTVTHEILSAPAADCTRVFSAKGPVTVTGLLLVTSLLLWLARLQYRVHLSERHLALDASEKKAFAETFLAMKEGQDVSKNNEAIILASLFRPTQDGIIKDDETGMDMAAAALLAKQLGRS